MQFDTGNRVVLLCVEGMQAEAKGDITTAKQLFQQALDIAENDFEAFTAAHYIARNQEKPEDTLYWNEEALRRAQATGMDDIKAHYPGLYLNVAKSYETLRNNIQAAKYYKLAADASSTLPPGKYAEMIKMGIGEGLKRTNTMAAYNDALEMLINNWCNNKQLKPLAIILPAYVGNLGTEADTNKLISALHYLSATRCLPGAEQEAVELLINTLTCPV